MKINTNKLSAVLLTSLISISIAHAAIIYDGPNGEIFVGDYLSSDLAEKGYAPRGEKKHVREELKAESPTLENRVGHDPGMRLSEPTKRFSSPEETWKTFKKAILEGDLDSADECFDVSRKERSDGTFEALGAANRQKIVAEQMYDLEKLWFHEYKAEYRVIKLVNGNKKPGEKIQFVNIDGKWKMVQSE